MSLTDDVDNLRDRSRGRVKETAKAIDTTKDWLIKILKDGATGDEDAIKRAALEVGDYTDEVLALRSLHESIIDDIKSIAGGNEFAVTVLPILLQAKLLMEMDKFKLNINWKEGDKK